MICSPKDSGVTRRRPGRNRFLTGMISGLICCLTLAGCGSGDNEPPADADQQARPAQMPETVAPVVADTAAVQAGADTTTDAIETTTEPAAAEAGTSAEAAASSPATVATTQAAPPPPPTTSVHGPFSLQLGSFRNQVNAERLADQVRRQGCTPTIETADPGGVRHYRVFVRGLADRAAAEDLGETLRTDLGLTYLILDNR